MNSTVKRIFPVALAFLLIPAFSFATDGYFLTGYGTKQQGQGGAGIAKPADSLAGATNPAGLFLVGDRFDIGLTLFRPVRYGTIIGNQLPPGYPNVNGTYDGNRVKNFELPELGYSLHYRPNLVLGVALYGNGGLNTSYTLPSYAPQLMTAYEFQHAFWIPGDPFKALKAVFIVFRPQDQDSLSEALLRVATGKFSNPLSNP
jgi:long-subunit fatty acid transport protein